MKETSNAARRRARGNEGTMINQRMYELGSEPSAIRELFAYGQARKAEIGEDNVFDFSIGNPSVPAPEAVKRAILDVMEQPPAQVHGYTPSQGAPSVRAARGRIAQPPLRYVVRRCEHLPDLRLPPHRFPSASTPLETQAMSSS